jgi:hypothetical protein
VTIATIDTCAEIFLNGEALMETIPDTYVAPSPTQGRGLHTRRPSAKNETLCILDGQVVEAHRYPVLLTWSGTPCRTSGCWCVHCARATVLSITALSRTSRLVRITGRSGPFEQ